MPYESQDLYENDLDELEGDLYEEEAAVQAGAGANTASLDIGAPPPGAPPMPTSPPAAAGPLNEEEEVDAAGQLLDVSNEEELDQFLGDLVSTVAGAAKRAVESPAGQQVVGLLKGVAKRALPVVGAAIGGRVAGPAGARIGSQVAQTAGRIFGLELEGLSPEDQEFEAARRFVRFASSTTHHWSKRGYSASTAARHAARRHAPGLLRALGGPRDGGWGELEDEYYRHRHHGYRRPSSGYGQRWRYRSAYRPTWSGRRWLWSRRLNRWVWR